jgi:hypothetical protein
MKLKYNINSSKDKDMLKRLRSFKLFIIPVFMILMLWGCNFLDYKELDQYSKEQIFYDFGRTKTILNNAYSYLPTDYGSIYGAQRACATDEAENVYDTTTVQKFNDGSWNSIVTLDDNWSNFYMGIRTANVFLKEADGLVFDPIKYNTDYVQTMQQFQYYKYEARFLRAFYYFELTKRYGSVPLDTTVLTQAEANSVTQAPFNDLVKFIVRECDSCILKLPVSYSALPNAETGRVTKGAAMALKARTLLYAASPLNNPTNNQAKWIAAAQAAKAIIDAGTYTLPASYASAVNLLTSSELIMERRQAAARDYETANTAVGFIGGNTGTCPSQNLVDAYEMKVSGKGITEAGSGYDANNPYSQAGASARDPRMAVTVLYNGAVWKSPLTVQTWYGGLNAPPTPNATKTGYYIKKYMIESISLNPTNPGTSIHYWVIFRYGEVLLNYAEAMNEAYGPEVAGPAPLTTTARTAVNLIRTRAAMPGFPAGMLQSDFRTKLRNERMVELAFEDHRFWDIRRWKIGPSTTTIKGVNITRVSTNPDVFSYSPKVVENRFWDDRMYLYPIPQTEMFINHNLVQNPGW